MSFVSYAQNFEDVMLWRALGHVRPGTYIDLGAADPVAESVTCAFYQRGWRGINVEPSDTPFRQLSALRPEDVNLQVAVGSVAGRQTFFSIGNGGGLSTLNAEFARRHSEAGWSAQERTVQMTTLADICEQHVSGPIHFLKIDVEGSERAVLEGADFQRWRPWVVLLEATEPNSQTVSHREWEDLLLDASYRFVYFDGLNRFYVAAEHHEALAPSFATPPNVFDQFIRHTEHDALERASRSELGLEDGRVRLLAAGEQVDQAQARVNVAQERLDEAHARLHAATARADAAASMLEAGQASAAAAAREATALREACEALREEGRGLVEAGRVAMTRLTTERDAYAQELFESNRHAAVLASTRQTLLDENGNQRVSIERLEQKRDSLEQNRLANEDRIDFEIDRTTALRGEVEEMRRREHDVRADLARTAGELEEWRTLVGRIHASTSWRLTRPVRVLRRLFGS